MLWSTLRDLLLALAAGVWLGAAGCSAPDTRLELLASAQRADPDFPDGTSVKLTSFAYIGTVQSPSGPIHIVHQRAVLAGMPAPRGQACVQYFDAQRQWLGQDRSPYAGSNPPLWTNGPYLFLHGGWPLEEQPDPGGLRLGNALDFSAGFAGRRVVRLPAYGSVADVSSGPVVDGPDSRNPESVRR